MVYIDMEEKNMNMKIQNVNIRKKDANKSLFFTKISFLLFALFICGAQTNNVYGSVISTAAEIMDKGAIDDEMLLGALKESRDASAFYKMVKASMEKVEAAWTSNVQSNGPLFSTTELNIKAIFSFRNNENELLPLTSETFTVNNILTVDKNALTFVGKDRNIYGFRVKKISADLGSFKQDSYIYEPVLTDCKINFDGVVVKNDSTSSVIKLIDVSEIINTKVIVANLQDARHTIMQAYLCKSIGVDNNVFTNELQTRLYVISTALNIKNDLYLEDRENEKSKVSIVIKRPENTITTLEKKKDPLDSYKIENLILKGNEMEQVQKEKNDIYFNHKGKDLHKLLTEDFQLKEKVSETGLHLSKVFYAPLDENSQDTFEINELIECLKNTIKNLGITEKSALFYYKNDGTLDNNKTLQSIWNYSRKEGLFIKAQDVSKPVDALNIELTTFAKKFEQSIHSLITDYRKQLAINAAINTQDIETKSLTDIKKILQDLTTDITSLKFEDLKTVTNIKAAIVSDSKNAINIPGLLLDNTAEIYTLNFHNLLEGLSELTLTNKKQIQRLLKKKYDAITVEEKKITELHTLLIKARNDYNKNAVEDKKIPEQEIEWFKVTNINEGNDAPEVKKAFDAFEIVKDTAGKLIKDLKDEIVVIKKSTSFGTESLKSLDTISKDVEYKAFLEEKINKNIETALKLKPVVSPVVNPSVMPGVPASISPSSGPVVQLNIFQKHYILFICGAVLAAVGFTVGILQLLNKSDDSELEQEEAEEEEKENHEVTIRTPEEITVAPAVAA